MKGFKHLYNTQRELIKRTAKCLCFRCGEKFHSPPQCPEIQLRLLLMDESETVNRDGEIVVLEPEDSEEEVECKLRGVDIRKHKVVGHRQGIKP